MKILVLGSSLLIGLSSFTYADWHHGRHYDRHQDRYRRDCSPSGLTVFGSFGSGFTFGSIVSTLPQRHSTVIVRDTPYYCHEGVYYRSCNRGYVVVEPPIILNAAPVGAYPVLVGSRTYYYHQGSYYDNAPTVIAPQPTLVVQSPPPAPAPAAPLPSPQAPVEASNSFYKKGRDWGMDLRNEIASREDFISYLRSNLPKAGTAEYEDFKRGFISSYGINAEASFDKAFKAAKI